MILTIVVVSFNTKEVLADCLASIKKSFEDKNLSDKTEIFIVDNGSIDGTVEYLKKIKQKDLFVIFNKDNFGFAKANNQAIKKSKSKYVLLLNSDTLVKKGVLENLVEFAEKHAGAGVIAPRLLNSDGSIQASCYHLPGLKNVFKEYFLNQIGAFSKYAPESDQPVRVEAVVGAVFLITPAALDRVGFLDERYFMYFEDLDYCKKIKAAGLKVFYLPKTEIFHLHGASGKKLDNKPNKWLTESSKQYHGILKHYLVNTLIWLGLKWQKLNAIMH